MSYELHFGAERTLDDDRVVRCDYTETGELAEFVTYNPVPEPIQEYVDRTGLEASAFAWPMTAMNMGREQKGPRAEHMAYYTSAVEFALSGAQRISDEMNDEWVRRGEVPIDSDFYEAAQRANRVRNKLVAMHVDCQLAAEADYRNGIDDHVAHAAADQQAITAYYEQPGEFGLFDQLHPGQA
ncbi:MAG TPA: hypothetical protein VJP80_03940 [Candidatus Saccharimonadales bacterium]|nr:hypothetical protein [Candidatus Saccharimonadales bacterium]